MLKTELHVDRIAEVYREFARLIGESHWRRTAANLRQELRGNDFLTDYFAREYALVFQLEELRALLERSGGRPPSAEQVRPLYPAAGFMAQVLSLMETWTANDGGKLRRRIHGAIKKPDDIRGLRLELSVATHFQRRGWHVQWPETLDISGETFDLLVCMSDGPSLEVECKSVGEDKARRIPRRDVLDFYKLLLPFLRPTTAALARGLSVAVSLPGRLPTQYRDRQQLASDLGRAVLAGQSCTLPDGTSVRINDFDAALLGAAPNERYPRDLRKDIDDVTATRNSQAVLIGTRAGGVLALAVQSALDDKFLAATFDTLSDAASRQLTGRRAGLLVAAFDGIDGEQLNEVASDDQDPNNAPSALRLATSRFLGAEHRDHIVGLAFFNRSGLQPVEDGLVDAAGGTAYYFPKRESKHWSDHYSGLFRIREL